MKVNKRYPFAPGVIETCKQARRLRLLRLRVLPLLVDFLGACLLVALAFFVAGWLL